MTSVLHSSRVRTVIEQLRRLAASTDPEVIGRAWAVAGERGARSDAEVADVLAGALMPVDDDVGRLLYGLVLGKRPALVVEFGTSYGLSTLYMAAALHDLGAGRLVTVELEPAKAERAHEHLRQAGLDARVEVVVGDALTRLPAAGEAIDVLFLDGWKGLYLPMLQRLEPRLLTGSVVVADDLAVLPEPLAPYLAHVRDPGRGYVSVTLPNGDGVELSFRIH